VKANRITLVTLAVADIARSRAYYEALGWQPEEAMDQVVFYDLGGAKFGLYQRELLAQDQGRGGVDLGVGAVSLAQNFSSEEAVDTAYEAALLAGASVVARPKKVEWGGYSGLIADPDGHVWELAYNPFWPLDAEGMLT